MKQLKLVFFLSAVLVVLGACSTLQQAAPETFRESIAAGHVLLKTLADTTASAKVNGAIDIEKRDELVIELREAYASLSVAEGLLEHYENSGSEEASDQISLHLARAQSVLSIVESALEGVGGE